MFEEAIGYALRRLQLTHLPPPPMARQPLGGLGLVIIEASRSHF
jgi:hypothetical protein